MEEKKPELQSLECDLRDLDPEVTPKTVGDLFELKCSGIFSEPLSEKTKIEFEQEGFDYALHIVEVKETNSQAFVANVTSYLPSNYVKQGFLLADASQKKYKVEGLSWTYESVLQEAEKHQKETLVPPPEKLEPYPYFGPIFISYPTWIWIVLALIVMAFAAVIFRWQKKRMQKKKLVDAAVSGMGSALTPYQDFNKTLRQVLRKSSDQKTEPQVVLSDLETSFRIYLTRALTVPAFDWSQAEILKDIKKYNRSIYLDNARPILRLLREFERAKGQSIARQDVEQLTELSRKTVEDIDRHQMIEARHKGGIR